MHAEMAEETPASPHSPRRTLFDKIARSDVVVLLLGSRYGDKGVSGFAPSEDEFNESISQGKDVLVFVQAVEMEPEQAAFLDRVRGAWEEGRFYRRFTDVSDIGLAVAGALSELRAGSPGEDPTEASARALSLAADEQRSGMSSGLTVRVVFAPLRQGTILDPLALEDSSLGNDLSQALREAGVMPQALGIEASTSAEGVHLTGSESRDWVRPEAFVHADGAVTVISGIHSTGTFAGSLVNPEKLEQALIASGLFAQAAWARIDLRGSVTRVAVTAAIPDAQYKGWGEGSNPNQMQPGTQLPSTVIAPDPPEIIPSAQVSSPELVRRVVAALKRIFLDAGAVQS
jgi:hypothetical protein